MIAVVPEPVLAQVWSTLWPMIEPAVRTSLDKPDVLRELRAETAQMWVVVDDHRAPVAVVITKVHDVEGEKRCLIWLVGGRRAREWGGQLVDVIAAWARGIDCVALWGVGRRGWAPVVAALGFERIDDFNGRAAWLRRIA